MMKYAIVICADLMYWIDLSGWVFVALHGSKTLIC